MRNIYLAFFIGFCLSLTTLVAGQTASTSVALGWTAPAKNTDGSVIAIGNTITYNVYQGPVGGPFVKVLSNITGNSTVVTSTTAGLCFALSAVEQEGQTSVESGLTPTVCALQPGAPSGLTVAVTITVH